MATTRSSVTTRIGATSCSFTSTFTVTTDAGSAPAIRRDGRGWWPNSCSKAASANRQRGRIARIPPRWLLLAHMRSQVALDGLAVNLDPAHVGIAARSMAASGCQIGEADGIHLAQIHLI